MIWAGHAAVVVACLVREPSGWFSVFLLGGWAVSAAFGVWVSKGWRAKAAFVMLVSAAAVWRTILYVLLSLACARGDCI